MHILSAVKATQRWPLNTVCGCLLPIQSYTNSPLAADRHAELLAAEGGSGPAGQCRELLKQQAQSILLFAIEGQGLVLPVHLLLLLPAHLLHHIMPCSAWLPLWPGL